MSYRPFSFQFCHINHKKYSKHYFPYLFPPGRELWHWRRGLGGGDHLGPQNHKTSQNITKKIRFTLMDIFQKIQKHVFEIYSHIKKMATSLINALKITNDNTKCTHDTNNNWNTPNVLERSKFSKTKKTQLYFIIYQNYIIHILYIFYNL